MSSNYSTSPAPWVPPIDLSEDLICVGNNCTNKIRVFSGGGRGLCGTHYTRWKKYGDPNYLLRLPVGQTEIPAELIHYIADISDLAAGIAAEHLVCADLLLAGHRAFMADQNCAYDIAVDTGHKLIRVQVKSTRHCRPVPQRVTHTPAYLFFIKRAGKGGRRHYAGDEFDLLALVALDIRLIAYIPPSAAATTIIFTPPGSSSGRQFTDFPFDKALAEVGS